MIKYLTVMNINSGSFLPQFVEKNPGHFFVLKTCQRVLIAGHCKHFPQNISGVLDGKDAYQFLLETFCGLKSALLGENEIVSQFKSSYQVFTSTAQRSTQLQRVIEKLFLDGKNIRTKYLKGICQKTYASITRKAIKSRFNNPGQNYPSVLVLGSGQLAEDIINQFRHKTTVTISARNDLRVHSLKKKYSLKSIDWLDYEKYVQSAFIINTIGTTQTLFSKNFLSIWLQNHQSLGHLFVDLGAPSPLEKLEANNSSFLFLEGIFKKSEEVKMSNKNQLEQASTAISFASERRVELWERRNVQIQK